METWRIKTFDENLENLKKLNFFLIINNNAKQYLNCNEYSFLKLPNFKSVIYKSSEGYTFKSRDVSFIIDEIPQLTNKESLYFQRDEEKSFKKYFLFLAKKPKIILFVILIIFLFYLFLFKE